MKTQTQKIDNAQNPNRIKTVISLLSALRRDRGGETVQPRRQGEEPLLLQQAGGRVAIVGVLRLRLLLLEVMDGADAVEELAAALDLAADEPGAEGELVLVVDLEGAEEDGGQGCREGGGEGEGEGVHGGDVGLEEGAHLVDGDAEEEEAVGAHAAALQPRDVQEAADARLADAEDAVEAEAAVADVRVQVRDDLRAERDALARVAGAAAGGAGGAGGAGYGVAV